MELNKQQEFTQARIEGRRIASCDQEVWVRERILTAIRMSLALYGERRVGADDPSFKQAVHGVAQGTAVEIIHTLGMEPEYVNLPRTPHDL